MSGSPEAWPLGGRAHHRGTCRCAGCATGADSIDRLARESLSAALAHAQQGRFEADLGTEAGRPRSITLPGMFSGWRDPVAIRTVLAGVGAPPDFGAHNRRHLYKIAKRGERAPLYIGMAFSASVRDRVAAHIGALLAPAGPPPAGKQPRPGRSEVANLRQEIAKELQVDPALNNITVQLGTVQLSSLVPSQRPPLDAKLLHAYETALQVLERPRTYVGSAWTFEEEGL